jgi:hypothetical protein
MTMRTVYGIRDTAGVLIAEHVRVELPTGKRMYWQLPGCDPRDGLGGLSSSDLPLYGSEDIFGWATGVTVVVTEGERARDALDALGIPALATVTGASGTPGEDALAVLLPFDVLLWPDNDEAGVAHMARVAARLRRLGGSARRCLWKGRAKGDDAADFVSEPDARRTLDVLLRNAPPWKVEDPEVARPIPRARYERHDDTRVTTARSHLLEVVEQKLGHGKKSGQSIWWCCPFHTERTPSFKVDLREPYYRCHGCGARGDVFTFLRSIEGRDFKDVIRELAPAEPVGLRTVSVWSL